MLMDPANWLPDGRATASPPEGLLGYPFSDGMLQLELDDLNILGMQAQAQQQRVTNPAPKPGRRDEGGSTSDFPTDHVETGPSVDEEARKKRSRLLMEQRSLDVFLQDLAQEEAASSRQEVPGGMDGPTSSTERDRKPVDALAAARTKASRERMRRERLNDSFAELSKVMDPGKAIKSDKNSIIADAIRVVTQLRAENGQLRQLNKFLEERVGTVEKQKSELLLQQMVMQQQAQAGVAGPSHLGPPQGMLPSQYVQGMAAPGLALGQPVMGSMQLPPLHAGPSHGLAAMGYRMPPDTKPPASHAPPGAEAQTGPRPPGSGPGPSLPSFPALGEPLHPAHQPQVSEALSAPQEARPPLGMGPACWLPPVDSSQDSLRRPPAA